MQIQLSKPTEALVSINIVNIEKNDVLKRFCLDTGKNTYHHERLNYSPSFHCPVVGTRIVKIRKTRNM